MNNIIASVWGWLAPGEPNDLVFDKRIVRDLEENEILVENSHIAFNPVDWKFMEMGFPGWNAGHVPGVDGAGIVIKTGENMKHIQIGSRVCYHADLTKDGSFSTHTIVPGNSAIHIPNKVSNLAAAAFLGPGLTAWQSIQRIPSILNQNILVSGAGGSVGYYISQLLTLQGAKVYVTADRKHHEKYISMGVIKAVDYKSENWADIVTESLPDKRFDVIFDTVGAEYAGKNLIPLLGYYGHIISIFGRIEQNPTPSFSTCISIHEIGLSALTVYGSERQISEAAIAGEKLLSWIGNGKISLKEIVIGSFDHLPAHLTKAKYSKDGAKYVVEI